MGKHLCQRRTVFQHQLLEEVEPRLDPLQFVRVTVGIVRQPLDFTHDLFNLEPRLGQPGGGIFQRQPALDHFVDLAASPGKFVKDRRLGVTQAFKQGTTELCDADRVAQDQPPSTEFVILTLAGIGGLDLLQLERDRIETVTSAGLRPTQSVEFVRRCPPGRKGR